MDNLSFKKSQKLDINLETEYNPKLTNVAKAMYMYYASKDNV
jgi:hypothetical protein